jgi:hypothetical protein
MHDTPSGGFRKGVLVMGSLVIRREPEVETREAKEVSALSESCGCDVNERLPLFPRPHNLQYL